MGRTTHYNSIGQRISKKVYDRLAKNPAYNVVGNNIVMGTGTLIACRHEAKDSERDEVYKSGKY